MKSGDHAREGCGGTLLGGREGFESVGRGLGGLRGGSMAMGEDAMRTLSGGEGGNQKLEGKPGWGLGRSRGKWGFQGKLVTKRREADGGRRGEGEPWVEGRQ